MPKLTIDHREVEVKEGDTILYAARKLGIDIPALCFNEECEPSTSCLVCVMKVNGRLVPSCATAVADGMEIESETDEVHEARRIALELLLSDHLGDCIAPCHSACPAGMNIPLMIRQIADGKLSDAIATIKRDIALPAVLGRICPAPCENICRRGSYDSPVSICLLKRYAADADLTSESPYSPSCKPNNGKKVAIVGAGPTGLAAAYYLLQEGYSCVVFDDHEEPGGMLRYGVSEDRLPWEVLDAEIGFIERLGAEFRMGIRISNLSDLQRDYDAVLVAVGELKEENADELGLYSAVKGIQIDRNILQTSLKGVFAGGTATGRRSRMAVRSVADGKAVAASIDQYISGLPVVGLRKPFTVRMGKLAEGEIQKFMIGVSESDRVSPSDGEYSGFSDEDARAEAARCLHCDCRRADDCKLRDYSERYGARPNRYIGERRLFERYPREGEALAGPYQAPVVVYEPGKCITCGLCIQITSKAREELGFTFIGRGFNVRVGVPFNSTVAEGLRKVAAQCVAACPTGALAFK